MADITMCANATPHCGKTFDCRRSAHVTKPGWRQSWASFPGGKDCSHYWPKSDPDAGRTALSQHQGGGQ